MKIIRKILGEIILFFDAAFRPRQMQRPVEIQQKIDAETADWDLYEFRTCPFCVRVRRQIHRLNLKIQRRDVLHDPESSRRLVEGGGKRKVPCLRFEEDGQVRWMYESKDINDFLNQRFASATST